jgi:pimeloyl-ACP methyl ester carboxylesterase
VPARVSVEKDLILIAGAGHAVPQERPQQIAERIAGVFVDHIG